MSCVVGLIIVCPPALDDIPRVFQADEPVFVQTLIPQSADEALSIGIFSRLSRPDEIQLHTIAISPLIQDFTGKLRSIVYRDDLR